MPDFDAIYAQLCTNLRRFINDEDYSRTAFDSYRNGIIEAVKLLGLWGEYCKWAEDNNIPDDRLDMEEN